MSERGLAAGTAAVIYLAIAALHGYWALGGLWPGSDRDSLNRAIVGGPSGMRGPSRAATWAVTAVLFGAAVCVLGAAGLVALPVAPGLNRGAVLVGAGVLLLRGLEGFVDTRLRPDTVGSRFVTLNRRLYSPLCLALGLLTFLAVWR